jgi:hypothetical protein
VKSHLVAGIDWAGWFPAPAAELLVNLALLGERINLSTTSQYAGTALRVRAEVIWRA